MKRLLNVIASASIATGLGFVAHQLLSWKDDPPGDHAQQLIIGVPAVPAAVAGFIGLVLGPPVGAIAGFVGTAVAGTSLDDMVPGVAAARERALAQFRSRRRDDPNP